MSGSGGTPPRGNTRQAGQLPERSQRPGRRWWRRTLISEAQRHGGGIGAGYTVVSYLLGGIIAYGGIGWVIGRFTGLTHILLPIGMLFGLAVSTGWVIYRYGRS